MIQTMTVRINGELKTLPGGVTLKEVAELYQLKEQSIAFELNRKVIERQRYASVQLKENDTVEIVRFVGGG